MSRSHSTRRLMLVLGSALALVLGSFGIPGSAYADAPVTYREQYRPQFHYTPARNWMNDPNGLVFYRGEYHLYYQYNPSGITWGNISWGHAVSTDLVHWRELPVAIPQDDTEYVFSGSVVVDKDNTSGFGTRDNPPLVAIYTSAFKASGIQAQSLAYSTDGGRTFTKYAGNPVIDIGSHNFRDPKVFWYEPSHTWLMVVALSADRKVRFYSSPDLKTWTALSDFGPAGAVEGVWEVPDLFPLAVDGNRHNVKWVLVVNLNPGAIAGGSGAQYFTGQFDGTRFTSDDPPTYTPPSGTVLADFEGSSYAPWTVTSGTAFGSAPAQGMLPGQGPVTGFLGHGLVNSFTGGDASTGVLTSPSFPISSPYLNFLVGGGNHPHVAGTSLDRTPPPGPVFADFEGATYGTGWSTTGDFVGTGPVPGTIGDQQPVSGYLGQKLVNTFLNHDLSVGTITSPTFTINSSYIDLLVGGGHHPNSDPSGATTVNLIVNGQIVATATGQDSEALNWVAWNVSALQGQQAQIQAVDQNTGGWGHILLDNIVFSSQAATPVSVETAVNLLVDGAVVATATGANSEHLDWANFDLRGLAGKTAQIQIIDNNTGGWGHILADQFTFAEAPALSATQRAHWEDYGKDFYASGTWNNVPGGKRITIAWMNNWQYASGIPTDPWRSAMTVPRELSLRTVNGHVTLVQQPVHQLRELRTGHAFSINHRPVPVGTTALAARGKAVEIQASFRSGTASSYGLKVRTGGGQETVIGYDAAAGQVYIDRTKSGVVDFSPDFPGVQRAPLAAHHGRVTLHILVDWSSVEVFADDGTPVLTDQIFPDPASDGLAVFATGGTATLQSLRVWQLASIWPPASTN
jgi:fructan beta-fructosidase